MSSCALNAVRARRGTPQKIAAVTKIDVREEATKDRSSPPFTSSHLHYAALML